MNNKNMSLFHQEFDKSTLLDEQLLKIFIEDDSNNSLDEIFKENNINKLYILDYFIHFLIFEYTIKTNNRFNEIRNYILSVYPNEVKEIEIRFNDEYKTNELYINKGDKEIKALTFSDIVPGIKNLYSDIDDYSRQGRCFESSYNISKNLGIKNDLVTGYIYGLSDKSRYLHSFIETKLHGEEVVIDFTMNAIINKNGYYDIKQLAEDNIIQRINNEQLYDDVDNYGNIMRAINLRTDQYNIFRDEFIEEFKIIKSR